MQICPRCGAANTDEAIVCHKKECEYLLTAPKPASKPQIAPDAPRSLTTQKPQESSMATQENASKFTAADGLPSRAMGKSEEHSSRRRRNGIVAAALLSLPVVYLTGYLTSLHQFNAAVAAVHKKPRIVTPAPVHKNTSSPNPTQAVTPPGDKPLSTPSLSATTSTNATTPATASPTVSSGAPWSGWESIHGTIVDGQLQATVWASTSPFGPYRPITLMVDTGATHTMVNGSYWQSIGSSATGQTATFTGVGGSQTVGFWTSIYVWPGPALSMPLLYDATEPGGVGHMMIGSEGIVVLLGQDILSHGQLVQNRDTWQFTYLPE